MGGGSWRRSGLGPAMAAAILVLAVVRLSPGPALLRLVLLGVVLPIVPGLLWGPRSGPGMVDRAAAVVAAGVTHLLVLGALLALSQSGLAAGPPWWCLSLLLPCAHRLRRALPATDRRGARGRGREIFALLLIAAVAGIVAARPSEPALDTDLPAHLGAVHDALDADAWRPPDPFAPGGAVDPRMGLYHGYLAALVRSVGVSVPEAFAGLSALGCLVGLLGLTCFFGGTGLGSAGAAVAAVLMAGGGLAGRAHGFYSAGYPSWIALGLVALGVGQALRGRWWGLALAVLSTLVHPFAWWAAVVVGFHAVLLGRLTAGRWPVPLIRGTLALLVGGGLLLLPQVLARAGSSGAQWEPTGILRLGGRFFLLDPFLILRWGGVAALLGLPLLLLVPGRRLHRRGPLLLAASVLPVWTLALDPLAQPVLWPLVGYLSERLGMVAATPALAILLLRRPPARPGLRAAVLAASLLVLVLGAAPVVTRLAAGGFRADPILTRRLTEMAGAIQAEGVERLVGDPRTSYGVRALRGGRIAVVPVPHASPRDPDAARRLAGYRGLLDPTIDDRTLARRLQAFAGAHLLIHLREEQAYSRGAFAYEPSDAAQAGLLGRIRRAGVEPPRRGEGWALVEVRSLTRALEARSGPPLEGWSVVEGASPEAVTRRDGLEILEVAALSESVVAGQSLPLRVVYRASGREDPRHPVRIHIRLESDGKPAPAWLKSVAKPLRYLRERGGPRSRQRSVWMPYGGKRPWSEWPTAGCVEERSIEVPADLRPGLYRIRPTLQEQHWRPVLDLRDYLREDDRFQGPVAASVRILPRAETGKEFGG